MVLKELPHKEFARAMYSTSELLARTHHAPPCLALPSATSNLAQLPEQTGQLGNVFSYCGNFRLGNEPSKLEHARWFGKDSWSCNCSIVCK